MGNFYTSIVVPSREREAIRRILERLKRTAYLSPVEGDYVYVYDVKSNQNDRELKKLLAKITKELSCTALGVINHDDDILLYVLYQSGRLLDEYNSTPGYFKGKMKDPLGGNASVLASAFGVEVKAAEIEAILRRPQGQGDGYLFAVDRHQELCGVLGLSAEYATMDYTSIDQREGPFEDWDVFLAVGRGPAAGFRREQAKADGQKKDLMAARLLLNEIEYDQRKPFYGLPVWSINPITLELLVIWQDFGAKDPVEPCKYVYPFRDPILCGIKILPSVHCLTYDPGGCYLGVGHAFGRNLAEVLDCQTGSRLLLAEHPREVRGIAFSPDGKRFFSLSDELIISSLPDRASLVKRMISPYTICLALHPRLPYAVIGGADKLRILDTTDGQVLRECMTAPSTYDQDRIIKAFIKRMEKSLSPEEMKEQLQRLRTTPFGQERVFKVRFSRDGYWLAAATSTGVKVYRWDDVLHGEEEVISPVYSPTAGFFGANEQHAYDLVFDHQREILLFTNLNGTIGWLNLQTGKYGVLLEIPGRAAALQLDLIPEYRALVITTKYMALKAQNLAPTVQIWDYQALLDKALRAH